ncbi:MAG: NUDIX domain-containing protein [Candidatus Woesearchaeota archaeon]
MEDHQIQKHILKKFMYNDALRFNEILDRQFASNKFNYHLQQLMDKGVIEKEEELYRLTAKGVQVITGLDGIKIEEKQKPVPCVFIMGLDEDTGKILVHKRKKQPFRGVIGIPGGKIEFGHNLKEQARAEFQEETGLEARHLQLKLITNYRTIREEDETMTHHVIGFFFLATGLSGELVTEDREGENMFVPVSEAKELDRYPDFDFFTQELLRETDEVRFQEADRFVREGRFIGIEFKN